MRAFYGTGRGEHRQPKARAARSAGRPDYHRGWNYEATAIANDAGADAIHGHGER
jgi:hypothetical protein